jgi:hypothetical protein
MTVVELKELAVSSGVKQPGSGWKTCCPPDGKKNAIVTALANFYGGTPPSTPIKAAQTAARVKVESNISPVNINLKFKDDGPLMGQLLDLLRLRYPPAIFKKMQQHMQESFMPDKQPVSEWKSGDMGNLTNGRLIASVDHEGDITQDLLRIGAKISEHVPICTPSFAARDLAYNGKNFDGCDNRAGRDPWGICDYIRDNLYWPTDAIFLDTEQFSIYCHPAEDYNIKKTPEDKPARTYNITPESHPGLPPGTYNVHVSLGSNSLFWC